MAREILEPDKIISPEIDFHSIDTSLENIFSYKILELRQTKDALDPYQVRRCVRLISEARCIYMVASDNTIPITLDAAYKFTQVGVNCVVNNTPEMQISTAYNMGEQDLLFGVSNSGRSKTLLNIFNIAKKRRVPTICLTSDAMSPLARMADCPLSVVTNEKSFFDKFSFIHVPIMMLIDCLFLLYYKDNEEISPPTSSTRRKSEP